MANKYYSYKETHRTVKGVKQKRCIRCKRWKEESEFHKDRARKDGLRTYCKGCVETYERKCRNKNRNDVRDYLRYEERHRIVRTIKEKLCSRCKEWKYESEFHKERRLKDGLSFWCKECSYKVTRKSRQRIVNGIRQKLCSKCRRWKKESGFYKSRASKDGLTGRCKKCSYKKTTGISRKK